MKYPVHIARQSGGDYIATCQDPKCSATGATPEEAADSILHEIRYQLELCPCTTVDEDYVEVEVVSRRES